MSNQQSPSKFEQMRSRRHMLNNLGPKPASKRDSNLIGGNQPVKAKPTSKLPPKPEGGLTNVNNSGSTFAK